MDMDNNQLLDLMEQYERDGKGFSTFISDYRSKVSSGKTPTGLNQWVLTDKPTMHDFNEDNRIIDAKFQEADAQFQESDAKLRELDAKIGDSRVNPNILHNWDFRNPINQRGQNVYTATNNQQVYAIDRWIVAASGTASLTLNNDAIAFLTNNVGSDVLMQLIEFPHVYSGKTLTASLRGHQSNTGRFRVIISAVVDGVLVHTFGNIVMNNETSVTTLKIREGHVTDVRILVGAIDTNVPCILEAVKLELGTVSTLANDPPMDFGRELAVCQRFYENSYNTGAAPGSPFQEGASLIQPGPNLAATGNRIREHVPFGVRKRIVPVINFWDAAGNASRISTRNGDTFMQNVIPTIGPIESIAQRGFVLTSEQGPFYVHWEANADL